MLYQRFLRRELLGHLGAVFTVLLTITATTFFVRLLGQAASGKIAPDGILLFLAFIILNNLPVLLSVSLFVGIMMTFNRYYRDSEMTVWAASGLGIAGWVRPVMSIVVPTVVAVAVLSFVLVPWSYEKNDEIKSKFENRDDLSNVAPGVFRESPEQDRVYFVEHYLSNQQTVANVFLQNWQDGRLGIVSASAGQLEAAGNGDRFLVLQQGRRYEGTAGQADYKVIAFDRYGVRVETHEEILPPPTVKALSVAQLLVQQSPQHMAELMWRINLPLSALMLGLLAIPLGYVNIRATRSLNLFFGVLAYMVYSNLMSVMQAWIAKQQVEPLVAMLALHGSMLLLALLLYLRRIYSHVRLWRLRW